MRLFYKQKFLFCNRDNFKGSEIIKVKGLDFFFFINDLSAVIKITYKKINKRPCSDNRTDLKAQSIFMQFEVAKLLTEQLCDFKLESQILSDVRKYLG